MSGGSLDYVCFKVKDAAQSIRLRCDAGVERNPRLQRNFARSLDLVAAALKDLEWYYSCDSDWKNAEKSIYKIYGINKEEINEKSNNDQICNVDLKSP